MLIDKLQLAVKQNRLEKVIESCVCLANRLFRISERRVFALMKVKLLIKIERTNLFFKKKEDRYH